MQTRIFKSGNSLAVRIPKELAFADNVQEVMIERIGTALVLRPTEAQSLADIMDICTMFTPDFMSDGRAPSPETDRDWGTFGKAAEQP
ncbi:Virulence-associated protein [Thiorhodovibrio winogradskyi]|uniref:Virulence-associated protein n=1 Tax=Thiorhodovibrio winogradskyi TaxID=77007 RepID=A0ABZ0S701_9GAMM|nr:type II toxin-antitoxin system VapB family antitoxin [Thiorhodovibrio winogradskyi]